MNSWCNLDSKPRRAQAKKRKKRYDIEFADLPIPTPGRGRPTRFPFDQLKIGQCFVIKGMDKDVINGYRSYAQKKLGWKFVIKTMPEGIGVWRRE